MYLGSCIFIYNNETPQRKNIDTRYLKNITNTANYIGSKNDGIIGTLVINKLHLSNTIYSIDNPKNNVEENVTILNDDENLIVLAAHSGPGNIAFFNDLDKLKIDDIINLKYKNENLVYKIVTIEEQDKDGTIEINKTNEKRLILTTCSKKDKNKQLVLIAKVAK